MPSAVATVSMARPAIEVRQLAQHDRALRLGGGEPVADLDEETRLADAARSEHRDERVLSGQYEGVDDECVAPDE